MADLITFEQALAVIDQTLEGREVETFPTPVSEARGHVLAADACSKLELPPFNKSAMDGYAIMADDERECYQVIEEVPAGCVPKRALRPGTAVKVMTGAPVPEGAGRVVMVEYTERDGRTMRVTRHGGKPNICLRAEDVRTGDVVLRAGRRLDALAVANLVACGIDSVTARRRARMAVVVTGDEIVHSPEQLAPGKIMDTNGPLLAGLIEEHGYELVFHEHAADQEHELLDTIRRAADAADIVVLTGGVSTGDYDFVPTCLEQAGFRLLFDRVAVKPGKPLTFAAARNSVAVGLPGNPVSVFVGFHLVVRRIAGRLTGQPAPPAAVTLPVRTEYRRRKTSRREFIPAALGADGCVAPVAYHGSAHLLALCQANGLMDVPLGVAGLNALDPVAFHPFSTASLA